VAELVAEVPRCALAVYAHPDDAEVSCGGTLAWWAASGAEVHVAVCAMGDKGTTDPGADPRQLAARRQEEARAAGRALGLAGHHFLGYPDGELAEATELRRQLVGLVRALKPDAVVCPDPEAVFFGQDYFNHRDHRAVGWAALDAVAPAAALPLYFPEAGPPHQVGVTYLSGSLEPDVWVDISSTVGAKSEALCCHRSQLGDSAEWLRTVVRQRAEEGGLRAGVPYAEGFRRLRLAP
jgi:LmbE family N-acetylglucosaminyl deacetylase